ncbi:uncharacterized protein [Littorina saxatilis]|uniref:uncharacterized protein n=1 Tax=Littorina saxatilis TaxID=31220 RepID=UPI0038B44F64
MAERKQKRLASLLNQSNAANLSGEDQIELQSLIEEYFIEDPAKDESDSDEETDCNAGDFDTESEKESDAEDDAAPLIHEEVVTVTGEAHSSCEEFHNLAGNFAFPTVEAVEQFACKCKQIKVAAECDVCPEERRGCIAQFTHQEVVDFQLNLYDEVDMIVMGVFSANMAQGPYTESSKKGAQKKEREKTRVTYTILNRLVCKTTFMFLTGVGDKRLRNLMAHFKEQGGPCPRQSKRGGRKNNTKSLTHDDTNRVFRFIQNYAEDHAVSLPGRVPGFNRDDILLLPSSTTKGRVHELFQAACQEQGHRSVCVSTFRKLWAALLPFVVVSKPMTDLCFVCQKNNYRIFRAANITDEEKQELLRTQMEHLEKVDEERLLYRRQTAVSKEVVAEQRVTSLGPNQPCSRDITMHYSFDFAQQVHIPHSPYQPGPIYFMTPRKVGIFGVNCEGLPQQINYLIDEGASTTKGSNAVISYLHHFFGNYGLGESHADLHCDNCAGQNKNKFVLWYFAWRVMTGQHQTVTINFMPPGHTKFSPDWCFGLLKKCFRKSEVHCLDDLCDAVRRSTSVKKVNVPQLVTTENGQIHVTSYNWQAFLSPFFRPLPGMKKVGHFRFSSEVPGSVFFRESLGDDETEFRMLTDVRAVRTLRDALPPVIPPPGLSRERKLYLFQNIRAFVTPDKQDVLCPHPDV